MSPHKASLHATEIGKLWSTYMGNSMFTQVLQYFQHHCDDREIKQILKYAQNLSDSNIQAITNIFNAENHPLPKAFDELDVNMTAPRLFSDEFYLHYLKYVTKAGLNLYSLTISLVTRKDIRKLFANILKETIDLANEINELLIKRNLFIKPPVLPKPEMADVITDQSYLAGFLGKARPLHALEITHLFDNVEDNATSKAVLIGFSQVAKLQEVKQYLLKGKELSSKHYALFSEQLHKEDLPSPKLLDDHVMAVSEAPFSDKLMMYHKLDMYTMRIRSYGNAMSFSARRDLALKIAKMFTEAGKYMEDGAKILIKQGWMELPPQTVDRKEFALT